MLRIPIGNDHGGYDSKTKIAQCLADEGWDVLDFGCDSREYVRYPHYARKVAGAVARGEVARGILVCSTGIGMSIAANRIRGVRASLCTDSYMAKMTRQHNDSNVLCLGGMITGLNLLLEIVRVWLAEEYIGGRHGISLGIIREQEDEFGLIVPSE